MSSELKVDSGTALAITVPVALFASLMPPIGDMWVTKPGTVTANMVRSAEFISTGISLSIGAILSIMVDSLTPFLLSAFVSAVITAAYEYILRKDILDVQR